MPTAVGASVVAATSSQLLWYLTRATGTVALVLLTATVVLGIVTSVRYRSPSWPGFALVELHRRVSLLTVVFLGIHVVTTVADSFAPIGWVSVVVPFSSPYRRLWLGLGTIALDLLLAVAISSLLRTRLDPRLWRSLHWLAYASWPVAVFHAMGTGTDPHLTWMTALVAACVLAVAGTGVWRLAHGWPSRAGLRLVLGTTGGLIALVGTVWAATGPLRPGWAARAGTPPSLLGAQAASTRAAPAAGAVPSSGAAPGGTTAAGADHAAGSGTGASGSGAADGGTGTSAGTTGGLPAAPFSAQLSGTIAERSLDDGLVDVLIDARTSGGATGQLHISLVGQPSGGGVALARGRGTFGPPSAPAQFSGVVTALSGDVVELVLQDAGGTTVQLTVQLAINGGEVTGQLDAQPASTSTGGAPYGEGTGEDG